MDQPPINPYNAGPAQPPEPLAPGSTMASPTSVEFALDLEDYIAWNWHKVQTVPLLIRQRRIQWAAVPLLLLAIDVLVVMQLRTANFPTMVVVSSFLPLMALAIAILFPYRYRRAVRKNAVAFYNQSSNRALHGHRKVEISPTGVSLTSELYEALYRWPLIIRVEVTGQHAFLDTGGLGGIIIPRHAFTHDAIFQAFLATVQRYQQAAQDADLIPPDLA
jgi:hypothetical protein